MVERDATRSRFRRAPKPLDRSRINDLALAYVARFSTTAGKLRAYLERKVRERGFEGGSDPDIQSLVESFVEKGYVDDQSYGRNKADGLLARGYGPRRIEQALRAADIAEEARKRLAPAEGEKRSSILSLVRRRHFGPYMTDRKGSAEERHKLYEKQLAAIVRAGHDFDHARRVLEFGSIEELEEWVAEAQED